MKKITKSILAVIAAASVAALAFGEETADHHGKFYNKISSGIVNIHTDSGETEFAGIKDKASIDVLSGRVDAGITASFTLKQLTDATTDPSNPYNYFSLGNGSVDGFNLEDWYLEFRPLKNPNFFTIGFHDSIYFAGSYLPIAGANYANGNFGSDVVFVLRPIQGIRIAAGFDLTSLFGYKQDVDNQYPVLNFGADWTYGNLFSVGLAVRNPINASGTNDMGVGIGATFNATKDIAFSVGYSFNDADGIADIKGENLLTVGATANVAIVALSADFAAALPAEKVTSDREVYFAFDADATINEKVDAGLTFCSWIDTDSDSTNMFEITPYANFGLKNHTLGVAVDFLVEGEALTISFPVYWKVSF